MIAASLATLLTGVDDVTRESARREAERELIKSEYHHTEPLLLRALRWVLKQLGKLIDEAAAVAPGGGWGLLGLLLLLVGLLAVLRWRFGALAQANRRGWVFDANNPRSAADHRQSAEAAAAVGDWPRAVRERFRAVVRALEERTIVEPRLGRTADEAAVEGGAALPSAAPALRAAAAVFDDVVYGGRPATEQGYRAVVEADLATSGAAPVLA